MQSHLPNPPKEMPRKAQPLKEQPPANLLGESMERRASSANDVDDKSSRDQPSTSSSGQPHNHVQNASRDSPKRRPFPASKIMGDPNIVVVAEDVILPPPRPGFRHVKVPILGIVISSDRLRQRVDRYFHWPMIILALLVLPILAIEFFLQPQPGSVLWLSILIAVTIIWFAFTIEFLIKIAIAECRIEYIKHNWLDVIIIIVPFLRPLRVASLARTSRVFTLRGVGMKFAKLIFTVLLGMEATDRLLERVGLKRRAGRIDPSQMTRYELMREVRKLRKTDDAWEEWYRSIKSLHDTPDPPESRW